MKKPGKFHRQGVLVMQGKDSYATAKNEVAAATIVAALETYEGRKPKEDEGK